MSMTASHILRVVTIVALIVSATAMSWAQTSNESDLLLLHKGHQISAEATMSVTGHGPEHQGSKGHHDTLCATACAVAGSFSQSVGLEHPLALAIRSKPFHDLGQTPFTPEPGRRPPKLNPISG
ncbi:hypothetical protein GCM10011499_39490 [Pelagibacterium lentulum]|jgi:hypothetical protein|uniref:DUF2946 domain-containing protein n=1 Tax=Pelagibacterium lentulum TaxID=2029865 RepID=A0A916RR54_9HYPH|nr:hypothetical protein GCM10011499_39490 [Pelagibacterium lentulum]